jgi:hypothetical protein
MWCVVVWPRNLVSEEALAQWELLRQKKERGERHGKEGKGKIIRRRSDRQYIY